MWKRGGLVFPLRGLPGFLVSGILGEQVGEPDRGLECQEQNEDEKPVMRKHVVVQPSREPDGLQAASALAATWWKLNRDNSTEALHLQKEKRMAGAPERTS